MRSPRLTLYRSNVTFILLIRHATSVANASGTLAGRLPGIGLDETGQAQAAILKDRLQSVKFDQVLSSPLERCMRTAQLAGLAPRTDYRLNECDYGEWAGRSLADLSGEPLWSDIQARPQDVVFPGGESMKGMRARAIDAVKEAAATADMSGVVGLFSHADVVKAIMSWALDQPFNAFQRIIIEPASVSIIEIINAVPRVWALNTTSGKVIIPGQLVAPR